jgi:hypothetical protein
MPHCGATSSRGGRFEGKRTYVGRVVYNETPMLIAETRGKADVEIENNEDYLTSAVFGHLRYLPPSLFWACLFEKTRLASDENLSLTAVLSSMGCNVTAYTELSLWPWRCHPVLGEPDLILQFSGGSSPALFIVIEAKLWSGKSGSAPEDDQLCRYLRMLDDPWLGSFSPALPPVLVYLTPRNAVFEVEQSLSYLTAGERAHFGRRFFRMRWQDILEAARETALPATQPHRTLLRDIADFLRRRQLEYFGGFREFAGLPALLAADGEFYVRRRDDHVAFRQLETLSLITIRKGGWVK